MEITSTEAAALIKEAKNEFFTVTFIKKSGELRVMNCRLGVKKHLVSNNSSTTSHISKYITVYDVKSSGYRNINIETLKEVKIHGNTFKVITDA